MTRLMNLYHVTSYERAVRILNNKGIDPALSQGLKQVSWYVSRTKVAWAIAHVALRHGLTIDEIAILHVRALKERLYRSSTSGVYCSKHILKPIEMDSASMWLQRQEKRVFISKKIVGGNGWRGRDREDETDLSEL